MFIIIISVLLTSAVVTKFAFSWLEFEVAVAKLFISRCKQNKWVNPKNDQIGDYYHTIGQLFAI